MNKNITVFLFNNGEYAYWSNVTAGKAYHMIDDYSVKIGNGHLITPKQSLIENFQLSTMTTINLSPNGKRFAVVLREEEMTVEEFINTYC